MFAAQYVGVPPYGSLAEAILLLVREWNDSVEMAKVQAHTGAGLGGDVAYKTFKEYQDRLQRVDKRAEAAALKIAMDKVSSMAPIKVRPLYAPNTRTLPTFAPPKRLNEEPAPRTLNRR